MVVYRNGLLLYWDGRIGGVVVFVNFSDGDRLLATCNRVVL